MEIGIADLPNILNYTYATVSNLEHTVFFSFFFLFFL